ncbi:hypothetical protein HK413_01275 [Mucilaginibacter sp. S1162]|uniref:Uncharacterized protein n=1 Tax=Mucilaginibacter humi TaxID=2732510 RepID=A0ABX1VYV7_9SPHI|nr:hypothetical protein [Mucilaginibacter humi]NNU33147.1 hypothetical protein [Mucilaginibacter humi]
MPVILFWQCYFCEILQQKKPLIPWLMARGWRVRWVGSEGQLGITINTMVANGVSGVPGVDGTWKDSQVPTR